MLMGILGSFSISSILWPSSNTNRRIKRISCLYFIITNDEASIEQAKQKRFQEDKPQSQKGAGIDIFQAVP